MIVVADTTPVNYLILIGEIEPGFQMGQQFQEHVAQMVQRACQTAGQLSRRDLQLPLIGGVDHAQNCLGLCQIDPPA